MSRTTTANYNTAAALKQKAPVWVIKFSGIATYFCTGTFSGITSSYKKYLKNVSYHSPKINVDLALTDYGSLIVEINDVDNTFTNLIQASDKFLNTKIEIFHGYQSLAISDFSQFHDHYIISISLSDDLLTYIIECRNKFFEIFEQTKLFPDIPITNLTVDLGDGAGDTTLTVNDEANFHSPTAFEATDAYLIVGRQEIMEYTAKAAVGAGIDTFTVVRNVLSLDDNRIAFPDGAEVRQCFRIMPDQSEDTRYVGHYENPILSMLWLIVDSSGGTNGELDQGNGIGMAINESLVDQYNIQRLGLEHFNGFYANEIPTSNFTAFWFNTIDNPLKWFEQYILKPYRGYFYITSDSKLGVNILDAIKLQGETASGTLTDASIVKISNVKLRYDLVINQLSINEINPITNQKMQFGSYKNITYKCTESVANVGASALFNLDTILWTGWLVAANEKKMMFRKVFGTNANAPVEMDITVLDAKNTFTSGDIISISSDVFPDWVNQGRGISSLPALVLEQNIDNFITTYKVLLLTGLNTVNMYTINKETSIDDSSLSLEANHSAVYGDITANDAYDSNGSSYDADLLRIKFTIQPPGGFPPANPDTWNYIDIDIMCYDATSTLRAQRTIRIFYNTSWTSSFDQWIYIYWGTGSSYTFNRVRADWFATDAADADDYPISVSMSEIWYITENFTVDTI